MQRKLAAILSADIHGYSRLVEDDDEATIRALQIRRATMADSIAMHHGRVVDSPGDNLLAEFPSVVDAVRCGIDMQLALQQLNAETDAGRRMDYRMGITVGDVVVEDEQLYGNGVNIAARLESLAQPGDICLSGNAYEQVEGKIDLTAEFVGDKAVKNIRNPIPVWRISIGHNLQPGAEPTGHETSTPNPNTNAGINRRKYIISAFVIAIVAAIYFGLAYPLLKNSADQDSQSGDSIPVQEARPAIIVLPFDNLSDNPEQAYFGDGLAEDISTDLAKLDGLFVVSTNSALAYRGQPIDLGELNEKFGINFVVAGSVRKLVDQIRISVRLINVANSEHVWSERYDSDIKEIFAIQDEIRRKILTALRVKLSPTEQARFAKAPTASLEAYDYYLRGLELSQRARRLRQPEMMKDALASFEKAIAIDPEYAAAYSSLALTYVIEWIYGWVETGETELVDKSIALYEKSIALDNTDPRVHSMLNRARRYKGDHETLVAESERLVAQYPNNAEIIFDAGHSLVSGGHHARGLEVLQRAYALYPRPPAYSYYIFGNAYHLVGQTEKARDLLKPATLRAPHLLGNHIMLLIVYDALGEYENARLEAAHILRISENFTADNLNRFFRLRDNATIEEYIAALRRAGIPE